MKYFTDLNIYGHISLELSSDNDKNGDINNVLTENVSFLRFTGNSPSVSGFANGNDNNKLLIVSHAGTGNLILKNLNNASLLENRIVTGYNADIKIQPGNSVILIYDSYDKIWRILSLQSDIKSITGTPKQINIQPGKGDVVLSLPQDIDVFSNVIFNTITTPILKNDIDLTIQSSKNIFLNTESVTINGEKESIGLDSGALILKGGLGVAKRINAKNLTVNGVKQRAGISSNLQSEIIDLSESDFWIYSIDQSAKFLTNIDFIGGTPGESFYIKIKSNGQQYSWKNKVKWPSDVFPISSVANKTDVYYFICLSANEYIGKYAFNYN